MAQDAANVCATTDVSTHHAVLNNVTRAGGKAHESCGVLLAGGNGACHSEIPDGGTVDVAEECNTLLVVVGKRDVDSLVVAEEDAAERLVVAVAHAIARRGCDVNISHQLEVLAVVVVASVDLSG